jgi:hypothetical protein
MPPLLRCAAYHPAGFLDVPHDGSPPGGRIRPKYLATRTADKRLMASPIVAPSPK